MSKHRFLSILSGLFFAFLLLQSCTNEKEEKIPSNKGLRDSEVQDTKPKTELSTETLLAMQGIEMTSSSFKARLFKKIRDKGFKGAMHQCNIENLPSTGFFEKNNLTIDRISSLDGAFDAPKKDFINPKEIDGKVIMPIRLNDAICLNCHGKPFLNIPSDVLHTIKSKQDSTFPMGFSINDPIGVWEVKSK